ncbi:MAG TPA: hypothetical protein VK862_10340 [Afifellaceae bacterium]|nr:hypothetical protein [Afifellaceae bacterium]
MTVAFLAFSSPGYAEQPRHVAKHRDWHVCCFEDDARKTRCYLLYFRLPSLTGRKADRFEFAYIGLGRDELSFFWMRPKYQQFHGFGCILNLEVKVDGNAYSKEQIECLPELCTQIDVGPKVDIFRLGRVMTLRRINERGKPF